MINTNFSCKAGEGRAGEGGVGIKKLGLHAHSTWMHAHAILTLSNA